MTDEQPLPPGYVPYETATDGAQQVPRGRVFGEMWWRTTVLSSLIVGVIGAGAGVVAVIDDGRIRSIIAVPVVGVIGLVVGGILGAMAGVVLGGLGAMTLVPYPGRQQTVRFARAVSLGAVTLFCIPFIAGLREGNLVVPLIAIGVALTGAVLCAPFLVNWYVHRQEGAAGNATGAPPPV